MMTYRNGIQPKVLTSKPGIRSHRCLHQNMISKHTTVSSKSSMQCTSSMQTLLHS
uniref:Uncharacterized protein n=1 Tax=Arundo donax TaxID=35708 RepID=A0A0A9AZF4_ARUDO